MTTIIGAQDFLTASGVTIACQRKPHKNTKNQPSGLDGNELDPGSTKADG